MNIKINQLEAEGFSKNQIDEIQKGIEAGLDVTIYAKKEFLAIQMQQIRLGLMKGLPVEKYARTEYDWFQMEEIREGMEEGVDISLYASPDISYDRMQQIRLGLQSGIDLSFYKRPDAGVLKQLRLAIMHHVNIVSYIVEGYDAEQLEAIRDALEKGLDIQPWVRKEYRGIALREIFIGLEDGWDVSVYAKIEYNWQQMREIRLGIEHMVDVEQYSDVFYSHRQMQEIRLGLEAGLDVSYYRSPMYTSSQMRKRRVALEADPGLLLRAQIEDTDVSESAQEKEDVARYFHITISQDEMEAYIEVRGSSADFDRIGIVKAIHKNGICFGIKYDVIDDIVSGNTPRKPLLIAQGKRMADGKEGWYEYFFRTDFSSIPEELAEGKIDYRDVEWFETVSKGQKLAVYHNAEKGEDGITITGKVIPAKKGREKNFLVGKGFKRLPDGKTYISEKQGIVTLNNYQLNVSELLVMKEVNMVTGNVEFDGSVLVEGSVSSGSTIKASKDIIVKGFVEAAQIISGGSVYLRKGMNGSGGGTVQAQKDVLGCFFEGATVYAGGNIQGDYFFKSVLYAQGQIKAVGRKGAIAGGNLCAENGLIAMNLGNPAGLTTRVLLGGRDRIQKMQEKLSDTIQSVNQELFTLENAHREFQRKYSSEIRNSMEIYLKIESAIYTKEKEMESLLQNKSKLEEELMQSGNVSAMVKGQIYEGVSVEIDGIRWQSKSVHDVTLKKSDKRIVLYTNN